MVRDNRIVLIDFGLSRIASSVSPGEPPVGGQTNWSPEKAASRGYDHGADTWAAIAVFVHMMTGFEPWLVRHRNSAAYLHYIVSILH